MKIEEFIETYSNVYFIEFYKQEDEIEEVIEQEEVRVKKSKLSMISDFLFEPRYEVSNLKFKVLD